MVLFVNKMIAFKYFKTFLYYPFTRKMAPSKGFITFWCLRGYSILVSCQIQPQEWFILSWITHRNCKIVCYCPISKYKSHQYFVNQTSNWQLKRLAFSGLFHLLSKGDFKGIRLGFDVNEPQAKIIPIKHHSQFS